MPSLQVMVQSGGIAIVSGDIVSGSMLRLPALSPPGGAGGIQFKLAKAGVGPVYIGLPMLSGTLNTITSGGSFTSGGLTDGMEVNAGDAYFVPRYRLVSGLQTPRIHAAAAASGARLFWEIL